jgi:hypothetical protein
MKWYVLYTGIMSLELMEDVLGHKNGYKYNNYTLFDTREGEIMINPSL